MKDLSDKLKGNLFKGPCPSREILKDVCSKWGALILIALQKETLRFSELRRRLEGVSEKMLAQNLKSLVADGFVKREAHPVVPPYVEYSLTKMGLEITEKVRSLTDWIEDNLPRVMEAKNNSKEDA